MPCSPFLIFLLGRMNLTALAPLPLLELTIADILAYLACSSCFCCDVSLLCRHFMWYHVPHDEYIYIIIYIQYIHTVLYDIICVSPEWICSTSQEGVPFFGWIQYGVFTRHHRNIKVFLEPYHICTSQTVMWTAVDGIQHGLPCSFPHGTSLAQWMLHPSLEAP